MLELSNKSIIKHKKAISIFFVGILLFFLLITYVFLQAGKNNPSPRISSSQQSKTETGTITYPAPVVNFATYSQESTAVPLIPETINSYTFKNNFTDAEILSFTQKFGLTDIKPTTNPYVIATNTTDIHKRGFLTMNKITGAFTYQSFSDTRPSTYFSGMTAQNEALAMLTDLGLIDQTVKCPITYHKTDSPFTFIECHRDWKKIGAPILNPVGLLNIPDEVTLSSLQEGEVDRNTPTESVITQVIKDGQPILTANGKARSNDFNTVTLAIDQQGIIRGIISNLRIIDTAKQLTSSQIITPQQALARLQAHHAPFSLTIPAGSGSVDWQKVYPANQANAYQAFITDEALAYIEKPQDSVQHYFVPIYVFRGTATLTSGYRVNFIQMVPALADQTTFLTSLSPLSFPDLFIKNLMHVFTPPVYAQTSLPANAQLQLRTFNSTPVSETNAPSPTISPTPQTSETTGGCLSGVSGRNITITVANIGTVTVVDNLQPGSMPHAFFLQSSTLSDSSIKSVQDAFFKAVEQQYEINMAKEIHALHLSSRGPLDATKAMFESINSLDPSGTIKKYTNNSCPDWIYRNPPAPVFNCTSHSEWQYDQYRVETNAKNVARFIGSANQQTIDQLASQPDIFPSDILSDFHFVFINLFDNPIYNLAPYQQYKSCYISGESPYVFIYSDKQQDFTITFPSATTYIDPSTFQKKVDVRTRTDGTLQVNHQTGFPFPYLYYEFNPTLVHFSQPTDGYISKWNDWKVTVQAIAQQFGLLPLETKILEQETSKVINTLPMDPFIQISLLSQDELNQQLPLELSSYPTHLYRINLLIQPVSVAVTLSPPHLPFIQRNGLTVVEIGAKSSY